MIGTFTSAIWTESQDLTTIPAWKDISPRDQKFLDSQTRLLFGAFSLLKQVAPDIDHDHAAVHLAVGPARTDREAMLRWAARVTQGEPLPMVQPAGAVGLLPNTPLSWISIKFGLHGEGGVWAGLAEAGFAALSEGMAALEAGAPEAIVLAVDNTDGPFVRDALRRGFPTVSVETRPTAIAIRLRPTLPGDDGLPGPRLLSLDCFSAGTAPVVAIERLLARAGLSIAAASLLPDAWLEGIEQRNDLSSPGSKVLTTSLLLALSRFPTNLGSVLSPGRGDPWILAQQPERASEVLKVVLVGLPDGSLLGLLVLRDA